jgi:hypothetical protein
MAGAVPFPGVTRRRGRAKIRAVTETEFVARYCGGAVTPAQGHWIALFLRADRALGSARQAGAGKTFVRRAWAAYLADVEAAERESVD